MTNVLWIASHSAAPLDPRRLDRWMSAVEHALAPRLKGLTRKPIVHDHVALIAWVDLGNVPSGWQQVEEGPRSLGVSDGYPIGFERFGLAGPSPLAIGAALEGDFSFIDRLLPPYANIGVRESRLTLAIDALGYAKVYRAASAEVTAWSNSAMLASLFVFGRADPSEDGWVSLLAREAFLGDSSPLAGVVLENPRTLVRADDSPGGLRIDRTDHITPLFGGASSASVSEAVADALRQSFRSVAALSVGRITIPLSGGRDSRLLAAIALELGLVDDFWTSIPPELDLVIAKQLIDRLDRSIPWSTRDKSAETRRRDTDALATGITTAGIWDRVTAYQLFAEGEGDVTPQTRPPTQRIALDRASLWGIGGEFGRAFYYKRLQTYRPEASVRAFWQGLKDSVSLVDPIAARDLLAPRVEAIRDAVTASGITGLHQLDSFYVFQRVRRLQNRPGTTTGIRPYFTPDYLRATLCQTPLERVETRYFEDVIGHAYPAWSGVPYSHELYHENSETATAATHAQAFWDSPFVADLASEMLALVERNDLISVKRFAALVRLGGRPDGESVRRMRSFNRLLNYLSYLRHLDVVGREFRASGASAIEFAGPVPVTMVRQHHSRTSRVAIELGAEIRRVRDRVRPSRSTVSRIRRWMRPPGVPRRR